MKFRVTKRPHFRVKLRRPVTLNVFFRDCDEMLAEMFTSKFFDNLDKIKDNAKREAIRLERYRARRAINVDKAYRILRRLRRVEAIDLYKMTQHIEPDFFGEKHIQFDAVKKLHDKKHRLVWFLKGLYIYLAFDQESPGWSSKRGFSYSRHRAHYERLYEGHMNKLRQEKWDLKRAKVRARRNKDKKEGVDPQKTALYALRRGLDNNVPMPAPILGEDIVWDD